MIVAGLIYLTGIAVILIIKPRYMFREDGVWKEFGIGRDPTYFTHVPFWLFAIIWAIMSYTLVAILENAFYGHLMPQGESCPSCPACSIQPDQPSQSSQPKNIKTRNSANSKNMKNNQELTPGYYMLNEGATGRNGVPRYVYLGPEEPDL